MTETNNGAADTAVFDSVFARDEKPEAAPEPQAEDFARDEKGRFAAVTPEPQPEAPAEPTPQAAAPPTEEARDPATGRMIPLPELLSERTKRQEAERRAAEYQGQVKAFEAMLQQRQQPQVQQQPQPMPDPYTDPEGFVSAQMQQLRGQFRNQMMAQSEVMARRHYGNDAVDKAIQAAERNPQILAYFNAQSPDPYGEAVEWSRKQEALARIGSDPDAYEKQLEAKVREKVLAELKAGNGGQPQPKFPGSLAGATATGKQGAMLSPQAAADAVFARPGG